MKKIISFLIITGLAGIYSAVVQAQQVIAASGETLENSSGTLSFTLGELAIDTRNNGNTTITQGFHQSYITITPIHEVLDIGFSFTAFPNPTTSLVVLKAGIEKPEKLDYTVYDINGKMLINGNIDNTETNISFDSFEPGTYFILVKQDNKEIKTYKILKQ